MNNEPKKRKTTQADGDDLSRWLFIYALCYAVFHIAPPYMKWDVWNRLWIGDLIDILTPFVMVFLVFRIYRVLRRQIEKPSRSLRSIVIVILIFGAVAFVEGHGIHLSGNAIARHLIAKEGTSVYALTYFFDEVLGHILWDSGVVVLSLGLIVMGLHITPKKVLRSRILLIVIASLLYGFTYFVNAVEGQTVVFMFPLAIAIPLGTWCVARRRGIRLLRNPVLSFFLLNHLVASSLFLVWGIWQGGFPQFSDLGWV